MVSISEWKTVSQITLIITGKVKGTKQNVNLQLYIAVKRQVSSQFLPKRDFVNHTQTPQLISA